MKKWARNIAITVAVIVAVVLALPFVVYIPPVQKWLVDKATAMASEATGLDISIGGVSLRFPLTLSLNDVLVIRPSDPVTASAADTIAVVGRLDTSLALRPLFSLRAQLGGLTVSDVRLNTLDLISDTQVEGTIGQLDVGTTLADLNAGTVDVSSLLLADAALCVLLSDTAAVDTTESEPLPWLIALREATLSNVSCEVHLPGDSTVVATTLSKAVATDAGIDLLNERYAVATLRIDPSSLLYDQPFEPRLGAGPVPAQTATDGLLMDYAHLAFSHLSLSVDSIAYSSHDDPFLSLAVRHAALQERCGLQLSDFIASIALDSLGMRFSSFSLRTPSSSLSGQASIDYAALDSVCSVDCGTAAVQLDASLSRHDLAHFYPVKGLPEWPLSLKAKANGNLTAITIEQLDIDLPTVLQAEANGILALASLLTNNSSPIPSPSSLLTYHLSLQNASFLLSTTGVDPKSLTLPSGLRLDGTVSSIGPQYTADVIVLDGQANVNAHALIDMQTNAYTADIDASRLSIGHFVPSANGYLHQATISARGRGFDPYDHSTCLEADAALDSLTYDQWQADSLYLTATVEDAVAKAGLALHGIQGKGISDNLLGIGLSGDIKMETNLKDSHKVSGLLKDLAITDSIGTHHPENLGVLLAARPDTTYARIQNGDFIVKLDASGPYDRLLDKLTALADTIGHQLDNRIIDQARIKEMLPTMRLYVTSGKENAPANILRASQDIDFKELLADVTMSAAGGINGQMHIHDLTFGSTLIDTALVTLKHSDHGLTFQSRVANGKKNPLTITALADGHLYEHGARLGLRIFDEDGRLGLRLGTQASMEDGGTRFTLLPKNPTIAYREFHLNDDNYIFLHNDLRLSAKVEMEDDDGTTIDVYSTESSTPGPSSAESGAAAADASSSEGGLAETLQDLTVALGKLNLSQLTSSLPFMPAIGGLLGGDFHIVMDQKKQISVAADVAVDNMAYEGTTMGNISSQFVYLQNTDNTHAIDGILLREGLQVASLSGSYINKKVADGHEHLDGQLILENMPLDLANGFITDHLFGLEGHANGALTMKGPLDGLLIDGSVSLDSATLFSTPYGIRMGIDNTPLTITGSKLVFDSYKLYASTLQADTAAYLTVTGNVDFSPGTPASIDLRVRARELQVINSKQTQGSLLFGKGFVSTMAMVRGPLDKMTVRGRINVLGKTDVTYLLLDSPLSTDNQMDELVKFIDFTDSTQTVVQRPVPSSIDVNMTLSIDQGAHVKCGLNADQSNYIDIYGGGDLRLRMTPTEEMTLTGRYTLTSGKMKYSLPVIPLKTFTIQDGSYVEFTGKPDNPTLNITATERNRATVGQEGGQSRIVAFDCGVVVTKTLSDMGLQFIISAPEDMTLQSELQSMTVEQRGKLAVTMLTTGMYLADGNTSGFSMNSALSSFLQSEINNIAGNALSTLDVSVGVDNATDASGTMHTDYSFQFAKRFWNNRLKVQIGGKVSSGQEAESQGQKQSFFDNVSMEYRLSPTSNQYLKLFYKQNVYDWLDGYTGEYGAGYIYKRKMDHWWDMFQLWKKPETIRK